MSEPRTEDIGTEARRLRAQVKELEIDHEMSLGCFEMISETLAALDQTGYDGKSTPPMMLNDWTRVIVSRDRQRIAALERRSAELEAALRAWEDSDKDYGRPFGDTPHSIEMSRMELARSHGERLALARRLTRAALAPAATQTPARDGVLPSGSELVGFRADHRLAAVLALSELHRAHVLPDIDNETFDQRLVPYIAQFIANWEQRGAATQTQEPE